MRRAVVFCLFLLLELLCASVYGPSALAEDSMPVRERFFRIGDGRIHIRNAHNGREANVRLLNKDGTIDRRARAALDRVFGLADTARGEHISLRLLFLLDYFSDKVAPGSAIDLHSGYRSAAYNGKLRAAGRIVAPTSTHMDAMAIDFAIKGVNGKELWELIRREECCGVGHYGGATVHLDCGRPRFWEAATSKVDSGESQYNRRMWLSTEYDRYRPGEEIRLMFSSVSDYPFGVEKGARFVREGSVVPDVIVNGEIRTGEECMAIRDRSAGKSVYVRLPRDLPPGSYRVETGFCSKPFPEMPSTISSNLIEVTRTDAIPR